jgi:thiamine biosynthesis protein ThiS
LQIQVNGELREVAARSSLQDLISILNLKAERLAIELNGEVVRMVDWARTDLRENDKVEIVHFVGGGGARGNANPD